MTRRRGSSILALISSRSSLQVSAHKSAQRCKKVAPGSLFWAPFHCWPSVIGGGQSSWKRASPLLKFGGGVGFHLIKKRSFFSYEQQLELSGTLQTKCTKCRLALVCSTATLYCYSLGQLFKTTSSPTGQTSIFFVSDYFSLSSPSLSSFLLAPIV